jgi:2-methylcitrate dehydratase PrpD
MAMHSDSAALISAETLALSRYMSDAVAGDLPAEVIERTKLHILDTFAAIISGSRLKPGRLAIAYAETLGGPAEATLIGSSQVMGESVAAMANGMSAHSDETDDSHFASRMHPGAAIVPAALAVAEKRHRGGAEFLRAVTLGYDVGARLVQALSMRGFASLHRSCHAFGGTFGAGAAAGALHRFDEARMRYLLSYCAQSASGCGAYMHDRSHVEKAFVYAGKSAQSGVAAAAMVAADFSGADDPFAGERNFLDAYGAPANRAALADALGTRYEIMHATIKKWCVGSPIQPSLDGLDMLMREHSLETSDIAGVSLQLAPTQLRTVSNRPMPNVNLRHLVALMLANGRVGFSESHDPALMEDPILRELQARVQTTPNEELERAHPPRQTIVEITTRDGRHFSRRVIAVRGTPDNPMSREEVVAKANDLIAPISGAARCRELIERTLEIDRMKDVTQLRPLLVVSSDTVRL